MATSRRRADGPPPLPLGGDGGVEVTSSDRSPQRYSPHFRGKMTLNPGSAIRSGHPRRGGGRTGPFSAAPNSHFNAETIVCHGDITSSPSIPLEARRAPTVFCGLRHRSSCCVNHTMFVPDINPSSSFFTDTDAVVHATLEIRPPAVKFFAGTDSQGRMDQRTTATLAAKG